MYIVLGLGKVRYLSESGKKMNEGQPKFSSLEEEVAFWKEKAQEYKTK